MTVVVVGTSFHLMAGSGVTTDAPLGNEYTNTDVSYSRSGNDFWDDDDDFVDF